MVKHETRKMNFTGKQVADKMKAKTAPNHGEPNMSRNEDQHHSVLIYIYFRFTYIFLCSPFRFSKNEQGKLEIYRWFPQQVSYMN